MKRKLSPDQASTFHAPPTRPKDSEIEHTIFLIKERLKDDRINQEQNEAVKEGYEKALKTLEARDDSYNGIAWMKSQQARSIAVMACEYLQGEVFQKALIGVPFK